MKKYNLVGQKFGRLTVISKGRNVKENGRSKTTWNCACECGKIILSKTYHLMRGGVKSCGCLRDELQIKLKSGMVFNRLTLVNYMGESIWECKCICGNKCLIKSDKIESGKTKSCGCFGSEISKNNIKKALEKRKKYDPSVSSARRIWQNYCRMDGYNSTNYILSFEDFYKISQEKCHYCGSEPSNSMNLFKYSYYKGSENAKKNGTFIYNGLDKVNNNEKHYYKNIVPCCIICNRAKGDRAYNEMIEYMGNLKIDTEFKLIRVNIPKELFNSVKYNYNNYKDINFDINDFYSLSQMGCFYCGVSGSNVYKKFIYNGIDRINNLKGHDIDNVVPCCKHCNFAKSDMSFDKFIEWINKVKK